MRTDGDPAARISASATQRERTTALTAVEALLAGAAVIAAALAFALLIGTAPARFMGTDDAYYFGIGANVLAGRGPVTVFGAFTQYHAPLWAITIAAPGAWIGADGQAWAHLLVIAAGTAVILLAGWFAWRAVPLAGSIAAAGVLAFPFMIGLATGMGLDLPVAALCLAYLAVGFASVQRGSIPLGVLAGVIFASAFLTKEIALPFAPVPALAGIVRGVPFRSVLRATGATLLVSLVGTSWWFVIYAQYLGTVYRIGAPWWTLVPIGLAGLAAGLAGLLADRWLPSLAAPESDIARRRARRLGWAGAVLWALLLTVMFAQTPTGLGSSFLAPDQVRANLVQWGPRLGVVLAVGLIGAVLEIGERLTRLRARGAPEGGDLHAIDDLLIATLCGFPLVLLVVSVGEGPRHYIAQLAILAALGACGWVHLVQRCVRGERTAIVIALAAMAIALALAAPTLGPLVPPRLGRRATVIVFVAIAAVIVAAVLVRHRRTRVTPGRLLTVASAALVAGAIVVAWWATPTRQSSLDRARIDAIDTLAAWVRGDLPIGSSVVIGNGLAFELGLTLQADYRVFDLRDEPGVRVQADAPLGLARPGQPGTDEWVAVRASPTDVHSLYGYRSSGILDRLRPIGPATFLHTEIVGANLVSPLGEALEGTPGATLSGEWEWDHGNTLIRSKAFSIDPEALVFEPRLVLTPEAFERIVRGLEPAGLAARSSAARLVDRVEVAGADQETARLHELLRRLAGP